jgi:hypothetical protein
LSETIDIAQFVGVVTRLRGIRREDRADQRRKTRVVQIILAKNGDDRFGDVHVRRLFDDRRQKNERRRKRLDFIVLDTSRFDEVHQLARPFATLRLLF